MPRVFRRCLTLLLAALVLSSCVARTQQQNEICPWLNAATAGGVLGEEVHVTVIYPTASHADQLNGAPGDATCDFKPLKESDSQLQIAVHTMQDFKREYSAYRALCAPSSTPLAGVGNEAVACRVEGPRKQLREKVIGRIRERVFLFSWSMPETEAARGPQAAQVIRDKLQNTAEQIAGSLF